MGNGVTIRPYEAGDEEGILVLLRRVFGGSRDGRWWEWLYAKNPAGRSIIWVAVDGEDIVGHMASLAVKIRLPGVSRPSQSRVGVVGQVIDSVVYPRYRRQGVMSRLVQQAFGEAWEKEWAFLCGFPNRNSYLLYMKQGCTDLFRAPQLLRIVNHKKVAAQILPDVPGLAEFAGFASRLFLSPRLTFVHHQVSITKEQFFDEEFTRLWEDVRDHYAIAVVRDAQYLNWRYVHNPAREYRIFAAREQGRLRGFVVLGSVHRAVKGIPTGNIVECLIAPDALLAAEALLRHAVEVFVRESPYCQHLVHGP